MKNLSIKQKVIIIIITILLSVISLLNYNLASMANKFINVTIEAKGEKNINAKGAEIRINNIEIDEKNTDLSNYLTDDIIYQDEQLILYPYEHNISLEFLVPQFTSFNITFIRHEWSGKANIILNNNANLETIDLYSEEAGDHYIYVYKPNINNILKTSILESILHNIKIYVICLIITFICVYGWFITYNKIKNQKNIWYYIPLITILTFLLLINYIYFMLTFSKTILLLSIFIIFLVLLYDLRELSKYEIEKAFLIIATLMGINMMLILPPGHVPDEFTHFVNSYYKAQVLGNNTEITENGYIRLPKSYYKTINKYENNTHDYHYKLSAINFIEDFAQPLDRNNREDDSYCFGNTINLNILPYLPSIIIIWILQNINISIIGLFLASRLINFTIWLIINYHVFKITPKFKRIFLTIMLMPISIQQAVGINQDWLTNALSFLLIAIILKEIYENNDKKIQNKDIITIILIEILLAFCKLGYFPLAFLTILIANQRFKTKYQLIIGKSAMIVTCLMLTILQMKKFGVALNPAIISQTYDLNYILHHPLDMASVYINTFKSRGILDLFRGIIDGFGWSTKWHSDNMRVIMNLIYGLLILGNNEKNIGLYRQITMLFICCCIVGIIYTVTGGWTARGRETLEGLQPRYFIPNNCLLYMALNNSVISINSKYWKNLIYLSLLSIGMILSFYTLIKGYYLI